MHKIIFIWVFILTFGFSSELIETFKADDDTSFLNRADIRAPNSHIKVYIPSIPYGYLARATNAGLVRAYDNEKGWRYDLAASHKRVDDLTYIFEIRKNLKFQDGSSLTIDNIIKNLEFFAAYPYTYTNIHKVGYDVEKIDETHLKIILKKKYEMLLHDLARVFIYTDEYLDNYAPKGAETGAANKAPGAFGAGPFIQTRGFALGRKQTEVVELIANPYFWDKEVPKVQKVSVYTQLDTKRVVEDITKQEGLLDIAPIPFNKKLEVLLSPYAKLISRESTNNFLIYMNLINGNKKLQDVNVRRALNYAINKENLLYFAYKGEGKISPFTTSINYDIVKKIAKKYPIETKPFTKHALKQLLNGLTLNVFTQDRFMFLFKGIEYQLKEYGVHFNYMVTTSEKDIYGQLLTTYKNGNTHNWDLLMWGDDDWYYLNPWTVFFTYDPGSPWSTIKKDDIMSGLIQEYFISKVGSGKYERVVKDILFRVKDMAYNIRVPSPNKVIAVNKEVIYRPSRGGTIPLWDIEVSKNHWSVRGDKEYPEKLKRPVKPKRVK